MVSLLQMKKITCQFPGGVIANQSIDFHVHPGEIHALLGENGAGKSTLMKIAFGMLQPTEGSLHWEGKEVTLKSVAAAKELGIGMVHQHFMLIPELTVWENVILGNEGRSFGALSSSKAKQQVQNRAEQHGLAIDVSAKIEHLSVGERQRVEILKALYRDIKLLILDEPTAVLTPQETERFFETLRELAAKGITIIFISHKLREIQAVADRITILRKGKKISEGKIADFTIESMAEAMIGRQVPTALNQEEQELGEVVFEIKGLKVKDQRGLVAVKSFDLQVREGEIVGIAGVEGNGQTELQQAIVGLRSIEAGKIRLKGQEIQKATIRKRLEQGIAHVPEDRHHHGLILGKSIEQNLYLGRHFEKKFQKGSLWFDQNAIKEHAQESIKTFDIQPPEPDLLVASMSGGNQQKVVIAREFSRPASFLLIAHPTRGVDIGAIEIIHNKLLQKKKEQAAILLFSSELPELLALCDRIITLYEGENVGELSKDEATDTKLGLLMTGNTLA